ncbi:MAG: hypothetical protein FWE54_01695 [Methanimicrococcus sp.]|nr:hypothetical protein [Methanimicrococcus sp.]
MIRIVNGFILMLLSAVITIIFYFAFSPVFEVLRVMRESLLLSDNIFFTAGLQKTITFLWDSGWVWFVSFLIIYAVLAVFVQLFLREERSGYY